jgi:hypothetical protein
VGVGDLNFTGNVILDMSDVTGISGTWTGRAAYPLAHAPEAAAHAEPAQSRRIRPIIPFLQAHGPWAAFNRRNTIE